jgi:hypothetical protein
MNIVSQILFVMSFICIEFIVLLFHSGLNPFKVVKREQSKAAKKKKP